MAKIKDIIEQAGADAEERVASTKKKRVEETRAILRDLTRLKFTHRRGVDVERSSVLIDVKPGLPDALSSLAAEELESGDRWGTELIGIWSHDIAQLRSSAANLAPLIKRLGAIPEWRDRAQRYEVALRQGSQLAVELATHAARAELLKKIVSIEQDILGVYRPIGNLFPDKGRIELYWVVIGATAKLLGVSIEGLTVAVLAHELAHAFVHVGLDSDRKRWEDGFWECDHAIHEAIAQYYTHRTVQAFRDEHQYDAPWVAYKALLEIQKQNRATLYVNHLAWVDTFSLEVIRDAILALRRARIDPKFAVLTSEMSRISHGLKAETASGR